MKSLLGIPAAAILGCFLFTLPVSAGPIQVTYTNPGSNTINLPGVGGVYTFPYYVSGAAMMCDDAQTDVGPPLTWWANVHYLTTDLAAMKWYNLTFGGNSTAALQAYEEAAIIFYEGATGSGAVADGGAGTWSGEGNVAVWYLFSPSAVTGDAETSPILTAAAQAVTNGQDAFGNSDAYIYLHVVFLTPDSSAILNPANPSLKLGAGIWASQEFIGLGSQVVPTPEPATYALFGTGLLGLGLLGRRRRA
jgi:hypothetical protein